MASIDLDLSDCCNYIDSSKITERKKRTEELRTYLQNPNVIKHLHGNSDKRNNNIQWNHLYQAVHRSTLKEAERYLEDESKGKSASTAFTSLKSASSLLILIASKANTDKARLSCRDLVLSVLEILENECFRKLLSVTYLSILNQNVLPMKRYWGEITLSQWIDLMDTVFPMFNGNQSDKDKSSILNALDQICLHGSRLADFIPYCKTLLKRLPEIIKEVSYSKSSLLQSHAVQLSLTLCKKLKMEYRLLICEFGENVLKYLTKMFQSRTGEVLTKKELIANLVFELLAVHHACEALPNMPGSMVSSCWDDWIFNLKELFTCLQNELETLGHTAPNSNCTPLILLAVSIAKLVKNESDDEFNSTSVNVSPEMSFCSPAVKRRKLSNNITGIIDNIRCKKRPVEAWPWFQFLELFVTKYPETLKEVEFISILSLVSDYLGSSADEYINISLWRCAKGLLFVMNRHKDSLISEEKQVQNLWSNIWSTALREFARTEQSQSRTRLTEQEQNKVNNIAALYSFIEAAVNVDSFSEYSESLLKLYFEKDPFNSIEEINIFKLLCSQFSIADSSHLKTLLIEKLLNKFSLKNCIYSYNCAEALFVLFLKSKSPALYSVHKTGNALNDVEIYYMTIALEILPINCDSDKNVDGLREVSVIEDRIISQRSTKIFHISIDKADHDKLLNYATFCYQLLCLSSKYNLSIKEGIDILFRIVVDKLWSHIENQLKQSDINKCSELIKEFNNFLNIIHGHPEFLKNKDLTKIAKLLFDLADNYREKAHNSQSSSVFEESEEKELEICDDSNLKVIIFQLLTKLGHIEEVCMGKNAIHNNVMKFCINNLDIRTVEGFYISITIVNNIVKEESVPNPVLLNLVNLLRELCGSWYKQIDEFISILKTLKVCIKHIFKNNCTENDTNLCKLIGSCSELIFSKNYGAPILTELSTVIGTMIKIDTCCKWKFSIRSGQPELNVRFHILEFLKSKFNEVRTNAIQFIPDVFENEDNSEIKAKIQSDLFKEIIDITNELFNVKENLSESDVKEEGMMRVSCVLRIILSLIVNSSQYRRKSLYILFKIINEKNINESLVKKILKQMEYQLNLNNITVFLEQNLDFIALSWYHIYKHFKDFPYILLSCSSRKTFYLDYKTCLIPILIEKGDEATLIEICQEIEWEEKKVVEECFPEAISGLLPKLADSESQRCGQAMYFLIQKMIGGDALTDLLSAELDKVLVALHEKLHDENHFRTLCGNNLGKLEFPQRTESHILVTGIKFTLGYLQTTSPDKDVPLLVFLCKQYPYHIHHMLHTLCSNISEATTKEIRLLCFHQYATLCDNLANSLADLGRMAAYFIRSAVHALLNHIESELLFPSLCFMNRLLSLSLPTSANIINNLLHVIVPKLIPIVSHETSEGKIALNILKLLMVDYKDSLPSVSELDRLPDDPLFSQFSCSMSRATLYQELEHFIKVSHHQIVDVSIRKHGLQHLLQQLMTRKNELDELYSKLKELRGFAEDCTESVLHRTIASLIQLTTCSDLKVKELAGKCLGELGPRNLATLVLKPEFSEKSSSLASTLLSTLIPLMVHKNPNTAESCCEVLRSLLATKEGCNAKEESLSDLEISYIAPFISVDRLRPYSVCLCKDSLKTAMNYWCPQNEILSHFSWITDLVTSLLTSFTLENSFFRLLIPLVKCEVKVAETVLPFVTYIIIKEEEDIVPLLEQKINLFFKIHSSLCKNQNGSNANGTKSIYMNRASLQSMLSVVNFYRLKEMPSIQRFKHNLNLNFLHVAQAAKYCQAYFTAILYAELWTYAQLSTLEYRNVKLRSAPLDLVCSFLNNENEGQVAFTLQTLLWDAYKEIGESDAVYGCGNIHLYDTETRIKYYKQFGLWTKIIDECELSESKVYEQDLVEALKMSGQYMTAMKVSGDKLEYDCAWRLGNWNLDIPMDDTCDYSALLYGAFKAIKNADNASVKMYVDKARILVLDSLQHASLEVANSIYLPLSRLQALNEIEYIESCKSNSTAINLVNINDCAQWDLLEPIFVQRALLLHPAPQVLLDAVKFQTKYSNSPLLAQSYLQKIMKMGVTGSLLHEAKLKEAEIIWLCGENERAKYLLKSFIATNSDINNTSISSALLTYGRWMAETKSDKPTSIIQKFFQKAATLCDADSKQRLSAADYLSRYADSEFQRKMQYLKSGDYFIKKKTMDFSSRAELLLKEEITSGKDKVSSSDHTKAIMTHQAQAKIDKEELEIAKIECTDYLKLAVKEYLKCLILGDGDSNDLKMFRLVSLWLDNKNDIQYELDSFINEVATYKFLPVLPQLSVRVSPKDGTSFISTLQKLLIRCCEDHPYHSLPILLALANSEKDEEILQKNSKKRTEPKVPESRVLGAKEVIESMLKTERIGELVKSYDALSFAYISLAYYEITKIKHPADYKIPTSEPIRKLKRLSSIPCLTWNVPVDKSGNYNKIIGIEKFDDLYGIVGGVNQPKKVKCYCSDGICRDQLIKGKDDLRQDAVMQQVFTVMNTLLRNDEKTASRKLNIRTYKVVPLSQRSGVIEWVKDTEPFGIYLIGGTQGKTGAHVKYRPQDLSPNECRIKLKNVAKTTKEHKVQTFKEICDKIKPVFRHFFFEKYKTPGDWFERKQAYTKSVATNSMIGYILGIGDRHVINILIDQITAEMIHIDFGIAFEQGRTLPTPETVPFRLTRDVVDGMGVAGVEGVFKRCCEETMTVLRKSKEPILTTLEVLLYDPLYTWSISPKKAFSLQDQDTLPINTTEIEDIQNERNLNKKNALAERALQRLKEKLEGLEDGSYTSVEGQVNSLIRMARDTTNLAQLFNGWQPYL